MQRLELHSKGVTEFTQPLLGMSMSVSKLNMVLCMSDQSHIKRPKEYQPERLLYNIIN